MPLTFAHPAAVLPFSRKSKYIHFSAMVIGSMAPDFEYFLRGQPKGEIGHTFMGFITFNLPLVAFIYFIYHFFIHQTFVHYLPNILQDTSTNRVDSNKLLKLVVFIYSALFGMLTHVVWDSFTHINGYMVLTFPTVFTKIYRIYGFDLPLYKFLQHGSTLLGFILIFGYMYFRALSQRHRNATVGVTDKIIYWSSLFVMTCSLVISWYVIDHVPFLNYGILVVRIIDSFFISLFIISIYLKYWLKR
ncbi:DUF4184 family protein [Lysinibacillus varians]|uniref:DUF4184 family protein n=1 Tax=Lysinibacillus varians TaxID=1145276 RepID=A0ABY2TC10_9BACI|nr:DUF4184 family protein [Lysinibacillus varians]AHN23808.1 hypothetical protein T479_23275 [Lysinibacillus varians]TKI65735.1 DUF4184 family protein [Lysinibacillus varians]